MQNLKFCHVISIPRICNSDFEKEVLHGEASTKMLQSLTGFIRFLLFSLSTNMSSVPTRTQVLDLYRNYVRSATKFNNYNFRNYFIRRSRDSFKEWSQLTKPEEQAAAFQRAREEYAVLERQSKISQMYSFEKLVVEPLDNHHRHA